MDVVKELPTGLILGAFFAVIGLWWAIKAAAQPGIVERQERTLRDQHTRMDGMQQEIDELRAAMTNDREELAALREMMAEWQQGMKRVFAQMKEAKLVPVWTPREPDYRPDTKRPYATLANRIADKFNIEEINNLAYSIGILPDEFGGETKEARARELVELASRRGIGAALIGRVNELRGTK